MPYKQWTLSTRKQCIITPMHKIVHLTSPINIFLWPSPLISNPFRVCYPTRLHKRKFIDFESNTLLCVLLYRIDDFFFLFKIIILFTAKSILRFMIQGPLNSSSLHGITKGSRLKIPHFWSNCDTWREIYTDIKPDYKTTWLYALPLTLYLVLSAN